MSQYRVTVRIELHNDETGRLVTYDNHAHYFAAAQANGGHPDYQAIDDAVANAIASLSSSQESKEK